MRAQVFRDSVVVVVVVVVEKDDPDQIRSQIRCFFSLFNVTVTIRFAEGSWQKST
jgi:hypothetical protein